MLFAITVIDYAVLAFYLLVTLAVGLYFSREQRSSQDFFLAGRSMGWFPVGLSIMATLLSALSYGSIPGTAYYAGLKFLLLPLAVWITAPLVIGFVLPLYRRLNLYSVYEYLELRFDWTTRLFSSLVFIIWRLLWLGGVIYAPCKVLIVSAGLNIPESLLILALGLVSTAYTYLGGMKAVIWTDVIQSLVMVSGLLLIIGGVWINLDGGAGRVSQVASALGRGQIVEASFDWADPWSGWGLLPYFVLSMLSFYVADQITAQRYLTARNLVAARRSFLLNCASVSIMVAALMYAGLALLAFYHDHPQEMRPVWVANVDNLSGKDPTNRKHTLTGKSITFPDTRNKPLIDPRTGAPRTSLQTGEMIMDPTSGTPLIDWTTERFDAAAIEDFVQQGRLLKPNLQDEPFSSAEEVMADGEMVIERIAKTRMTHASDEDFREFILNERAQDELMPRFVARHLPLGLAGLILAALFAASMSSMDSGVHSIATLIVTDFSRRLGWGRNWLAKRASKPIDQLTEVDELRLARLLVLVIGVAATLSSLLLAQVENFFAVMIAVVNTLGGPLMSVFLLGMFTRRCTGTSALVSLIAGTAITAWLTAPHISVHLAWMWPFRQKLGPIWPLTFGVAFTLVVGYLLSFVLGRRKTNEQLRGLVVGVGPLGVRDEDEASLAIGDISTPGGED